jgi:hypothetical protein
MELGNDWIAHCEIYIFLKAVAEPNESGRAVKGMLEMVNVFKLVRLVNAGRDVRDERETKLR